jgi:hypothetical protein
LKRAPTSHVAWPNGLIIIVIIIIIIFIKDGWSMGEDAKLVGRGN